MAPSSGAAGEEPTASSIDIEALVGLPEGSPLEGPELSERTAALGGAMRCPVCQGLSIADSPSPSAVSMLRQVRDLLAAGYTREQVLAYFEGQTKPIKGRVHARCKPPAEPSGSGVSP